MASRTRSRSGPLSNASVISGGGGARKVTGVHLYELQGSRVRSRIRDVRSINPKIKKRHHTAGGNNGQGIRQRTPYKAKVRKNSSIRIHVRLFYTTISVYAIGKYTDNFQILSVGRFLYNDMVIICKTTGIFSSMEHIFGNITLKVFANGLEMEEKLISKL